MVILFIYFMTNSTFNPTCADDGYVNEYAYVCIQVTMHGYVFKNVYVGVLVEISKL